MRRLIAFSSRHWLPALLFVTVLAAAGAFAFSTLPKDALPDWTDAQVIVSTRFEAAPELVQSRVTYPVSAALQGVPGVIGVRGYSMYGNSQVYVAIDSGRGSLQARSEIRQALDQLQGQLPPGAVPQLGPEANATGWIYQYALTDASHRRSLSELRDLQDWIIRPELGKVPGVAEVAGVGGFQSQFQVIVDPVKLDALSITIESVAAAIKAANSELTARTLDFGGQNFLLRSPGLLTSLSDLNNVVLPAPHVSVEARLEHVTNRPVLLKSISQIQTGPDLRENVTDLGGAGEAVGGIVILRQSENASAALRAVKDKIRELQPRLPAGVHLVPVYDRSRLIDSALHGFRRELLFTVFIVSAVILLFLWDLPSALVAILTIPLCLCLSGLLLRLLHVEMNILSLTGLAISVGVLVDGAIIQVENVHHAFEQPNAARHPRRTVIAALQQVSPSVVLALGIIVLAFLPLLALTGTEGHLFRPLVLAKTSAMIAAVFCAVVATPAARMACCRLWPGRRTSPVHWFSRVAAVYERLLQKLLLHPWIVLIAALIILEWTVPAFLKIGSEFLPPFEEGSRLFMPTVSAGISVDAARSLIQRQDRALRAIPEVATVFAKAGRADTATDPAPLSMVETNIELRPETTWRVRPRWYTGAVPDGLADRFLRPFWPDRITSEELDRELDRAVQFPGVLNAWTSPIRGRADMLSSGSRTAFVLKVIGPSPAELERISRRIELALRQLPGTGLAYAEPAQNGYFLDIDFDRDKLTELGLELFSAQQQIIPALGGITATTIYDQARIPRPVYVRYPRDYRDTVEAVGQLPITTPNEETIPLHSIASIAPRSGPVMIRSEGGVPAAYLYLEPVARDLGDYRKRAQAAVASQVSLPPEYRLEWAGRFADLERLHSRLRWIVPGTVLLIALLLCAGTGSLFYAALILLAVPFSLTGAIWSMALLNYKFSAAAWVGLLALLGLDAETGIFMVLFLDLAWRRRRSAAGAAPLTESDLRESVLDGAARRLRPKLMTVLATLAGMLPVVLSQAPGADFMRRLAVPICGGLLSSFVLELLVYPPCFLLWQRRMQARTESRSAFYRPSTDTGLM